MVSAEKLLRAQELARQGKETLGSNAMAAQWLASAEMFVQHDDVDASLSRLVPSSAKQSVTRGATDLNYSRSHFSNLAANHRSHFFAICFD